MHGWEAACDVQVDAAAGGATEPSAAAQIGPMPVLRPAGGHDRRAAEGPDRPIDRSPSPNTDRPPRDASPWGRGDGTEAPWIAATTSTTERQSCQDSSKKRACRAQDGAVKSPFRNERKRHPAFWMRPSAHRSPPGGGAGWGTSFPAGPRRLPGDHRAWSLLPSQ
jgi:hypothetical protein